MQGLMFYNFMRLIILTQSNDLISIKIAAYGMPSSLGRINISQTILNLTTIEIIQIKENNLTSENREPFNRQL